MENPVFLVRIRMKQFIPLEFFAKMILHSEIHDHLFTAFTETTKIFCTICVNY